MKPSEKRKYDEFFEATGDEDKAERLFIKWKCLTDLYFLATAILGWDKTPRGKKRIDPRFHKWLIQAMAKEGDKMILVPRDHMKSSWTKLQIVQDILNDPNIRILLASATKRLVTQELLDIKRILSTPVLRSLFPEIIPDPGKDFNGWEKSTEQELTIKRDPEAGYVPQGPQVLAVGVGANITGFHFDIAYLDDVLTEKNVTTADQIQKTIDWWGYLQPMLDTMAPVTVIGTPYHYADLYAVIEREKLLDSIVKRPAIQNGKPIYKYFTIKSLMARKRKMRDDYKFSCQYMLNPTPIEEKIFPPPHPTTDRLPEGDYKYYITCDPAATTKAWSDHSGIVVGALSEERRLTIVEAIKVKISGDRLADLLIKKAIQYNPKRIGIELGQQEHLKYIIGLKLDEYNRIHKTRIQFPLMPIKTPRTKSKAQKIADTFGAFCRAGRCQILDTCVQLLQQMDMYTGRDADEDDLLDAAGMLFNCIESFAQHLGIPIPEEDPNTILGMFKPERPTWEEKFVK
jgi:hypothetical protein